MWPGRGPFLQWVRPPHSLEPHRWHCWQPQLPRDQGVGVLIEERVAEWLDVFSINTSLNNIRSLRTTQRVVSCPRQLPPLEEWSLFTTDSSRPGVRGNINTPDTETSTLALSLRAIFVFVALFWLLLHDSKLPLGATAFSLHHSKPDHENLRSSTPAVLSPPQLGRLHTAIWFRSWRMCPLSVCSHPEPTAINVSFVQALGPPLAISPTSPTYLVLTKLILRRETKSIMRVQGKREGERDTQRD